MYMGHPFVKPNIHIIRGCFSPKFLYCQKVYPSLQVFLPEIFPTLHCTVAISPENFILFPAFFSLSPFPPTFLPIYSVHLNLAHLAHL